MNFEYNDIDVGDNFKISPSQIEKFFTYPRIWYEEQVLGKKDFKGNTSTVLGTIIHAIAEAYAKKESTSREEVEVFLKKRSLELMLTDPLDLDLIRDLYPQMSMALVNEYLARNLPTEVEAQLITPITDSVVVAGSCDNRTNSIVVDYKNVGTKPSNLDTIPFGYKIQLLAYAYMFKHRGEHIDRIRIVYTVRPTKTLPVRVFEVTEVISKDDWKLVENTLKLIAETVELSKANPAMNYLLFKSYDLKGD